MIRRVDAIVNVFNVGDKKIQSCRIVAKNKMKVEKNNLE